MSNRDGWPRPVETQPAEKIIDLTALGPVQPFLPEFTTPHAPGLIDLTGKMPHVYRAPYIPITPAGGLPGGME